MSFLPLRYRVEVLRLGEAVWADYPLPGGALATWRQAKVMKVARQMADGLLATVAEDALPDQIVAARVSCSGVLGGDDRIIWERQTPYYEIETRHDGSEWIISFRLRLRPIRLRSVADKEAERILDQPRYYRSRPTLRNCWVPDEVRVVLVDGRDALTRRIVWSRRRDGR